MGYTHYWNIDDNRVSEEGWLQALPLIAKIVKSHGKTLQYETDDRRLPVVTNKLIRFNGVEDEGHETFLVQLGDSAFCKTARKEYDLAVCECLLVLKYFIPDMHLGSDGFYGVSPDELDGVWDDALKNIESEFGLCFERKFEKRKDGSYIDLVDLIPLAKVL